MERVNKPNINNMKTVTVNVAYQLHQNELHKLNDVYAAMAELEAIIIANLSRYDKEIVRILVTQKSRLLAAKYLKEQTGLSLSNIIKYINHVIFQYHVEFHFNKPVYISNQWKQ